jgi:hypothetical protein
METPHTDLHGTSKTESNANGVETPLKPPGLIARLLGRKPKENAFVEIKNLITHTPIRDLDPQQVEQVLASYGIDDDEAEPQLRNLYQMVMRNVVRDGEVSDEEIEELSHLRHVFGLSDADVRDIEEAIIEDAYRTQTRMAVGDSHLTDEEKRRLQVLASRLRISEDLAKSIREEEVAKVFERVFNATIVDRRLSVEEEKLLKDLAANLGVKMELDGATLKQLDRFRLLWRIEQGEMPTLESKLPLEPEENVHFAAPAKRYTSKTTSGAGASGRKRVRLGRAVYWQLDKPALEADGGEQWEEVGSGTLSVTNHRLIFSDDGEPFSLPTKGMIRFTVYKDGIQVEMDDGTDHLLTIDGDAEIAGTILGVFVKATRG